MSGGAATVENSMQVPQKLKIELPYNPAITFLGNISAIQGTLKSLLLGAITVGKCGQGPQAGPSALTSTYTRALTGWDSSPGVAPMTLGFQLP